MIEQPKVLLIGRDIINSGGGYIIKETSKGLDNYGFELKILTDNTSQESSFRIPIIVAPFCEWLLS